MTTLPVELPEAMFTGVLPPVAALIFTAPDPERMLVVLVVFELPRLTVLAAAPVPILTADATASAPSEKAYPA